MSKQWIIDVMGDLRGFAQTNAMPALSAQLEEAIAVASAEIEQVAPMQAGRYGAETGRCARAACQGA